MLLPAIQTLITRELRAVKREVEAYPDDASLWRPIPGVPNTGGTLALHVAGNLQHFFGAILARDGYQRNRDAEFARRDVPRRELLAGLDAAITSVERTLSGLSDADLAAPYPEPIAKRTVATSTFLTHLAAHLAYHLGQMDVHRRAVTGVAQGVDAVSVRELPEVS
ncbi:MAG TPA: DinB family protein [Gemmatimonadaceae bacterium]|nr:DinB family protein [Gemmatimonadaceae bacterium]